MNARLAIAIALTTVLTGCAASSGVSVELGGGGATGQMPGADPECTVSWDGETETVSCPTTVDSGGAGEGVSPASEGTGEVLCTGVDEAAPGAPPGTDCSAPDAPEFGPVEPRPGMVDPKPVAWESAEVSGRSVTVSWWSGVEPCTVLDRVEVTETAKRVTVTLFEGSDPEHDGEDCIAMAQAKSTTVRLDARLGDRKLVDGAD